VAFLRKPDISFFEFISSLKYDSPPKKRGYQCKTRTHRDGAADMLKEWGNGQAPAREAAKAGDMKTGIPLFVNAIGGPGALTVVPMPTRG